MDPHWRLNYQATVLWVDEIQKNPFFCSCFASIIIVDFITGTKHAVNFETQILERFLDVGCLDRLKVHFGSRERDRTYTKVWLFLTV